jgi:hypothetical protein
MGFFGLSDLKAAGSSQETTAAINQARDFIYAEIESVGPGFLAGAI